MKKYFYSLFAAATMLLAATSCQQDEELVQPVSEMTSFSVSLTNAVGTRAIADGTTANKLYYEVYRENATDPIIDGVVENIKLQTSIEMPLLKGEKYDIIFWAQNEEAGIYDVTDLKNIEVNYNNQDLTANQEKYDAFYNALNDFKADGKAHTIELRRPFAQLNLGTSDWETAKKGLAENEGDPVTHTQVTVKGLATTFNTLDGEAKGDATATFTYSEIPGKDNAEVLTINNVQYTYLSMNYLLVPGTKDPQGVNQYEQAEKEGESKAIVEVQFALKRGDTELFKLDVPNAPVQRNWRTNVVGELLTGTSFEIVIKPELDGEYGNADALKEILKKGGEYTLPYNIELTEAVEIPSDVTVKLNLDGHTIVGVTGRDADGNRVHVIKNFGTLEIVGEGTIKSAGVNGGSALYNEGTMTVDGVTLEGSEYVKNSNEYYPSYAVNNYGKLTISNSTITAGHGAIATNDAATTEVNNVNATMGSEPITSHCFYIDSAGGSLTVNGGSYVNRYGSNTGGSVCCNAGTVTITGGTFKGDYMIYNSGTVTLTGGTYNKDVTAYVAEDYEVITETDEEGNTLYYVVPTGTTDVVTISSVVELTAFAANVNNGDNFAGKTVLLTADLDLNNAAWTPIGNCTSGKYFQGTFDGQGHTIYNLNVDDSKNTSKYAHAGLFGWVDAAGATVKNVNVDGATVKGSHWTGVIAGYFTGRIENCTVTNATVEAVDLNADANGDKVGGIVGFLNEDSELNNNTVSNSTIKGNRDIGGIAGSVAKSTDEMQNNKVKDVTITYETAKADYASAGAIVSGRTGYVADETNVATNVTIILNATSAVSLAQVLTANDKNIEVVLQDDIDLPIGSLGSQTTGSGEYKLGGESTESITIDLNNHKLNLTTTYWSSIGCKNSDATITIKNGTMTSSQTTGTWNSYDVTFANCNYDIKDVTFSKAIAFTNGDKNVTLNNVIITETHDYYAMWISAKGQTVTIDNLTVDSSGRGIKIDEEYVSSPAKVTLNIKNSTFGTAKKAAIMVKSSAGADINVENVDITKVTSDKDYVVWVDADAVEYADKVTVTGGLMKIELDDNTKLKANTEGVYEIGSAVDLLIMNEMMAAQNKSILGKDAKIKLTEDVDFTGFVWTPVDSHADRAFTLSEIDGNNKTIKNLTVNGQAMFTRFAGSGDVTIKNLTFENATVTSSAINTSILTVHSYQNVTLDNVDVKNSTITGGYKVAPLIATVYNENANTTVTATLKNCDVANCTVKATTYDFCTAGMVAFVYVDDNDKIEFESCTVKDVKLIAPDDNYKAHAAVYTTGSSSLYNEAEGVTVTNVTFEALQ